MFFTILFILYRYYTLISRAIQYNLKLYPDSKCSIISIYHVIVQIFSQIINFLFAMIRGITYQDKSTNEHNFYHLQLFLSIILLIFVPIFYPF